MDDFTLLSEKQRARFWAKTVRDGDCILWIAAKHRLGYGHVKFGDHVQYSHRVSYSMAFGKIPDEMVVDHTCHNRACVNPDHLRTVTRKQNAENRAGLPVTNKSGARGVCWNKKASKWYGAVSHRGKVLHVGAFDDVASAEAAVIAKRNSLFTHNDIDR